MASELLQETLPSVKTTRNSDSFLPLIVSSGLLLALCAVDLFFTIKLCGGHYVYALDDAYIGAAMAKNFALYGVWGVTRHAFTSSSSTPLWLLVLACAYRLFGVSHWMPLVLSLVFAVLVLVAADRLLLKSLPQVTRASGLIAIVLFTPLNVVGLIGMEHSLHIVLTIIFLRLSADLVVDGRWSLWLWAIVPAFVMVRYESLFLVAGTVLFLALQKRWKTAILMSALGWLPVIVYGAVSVSKGWYWLPNSISMKGTSGNLFFHHLLYVYSHGPHLVAVLAALPILAFVARGNRLSSYMLWTIFIAGCLHVALARVGWTYRYEDYLLAAAVVATAVAFPTIEETIRRNIALTLVVVLPATLLMARCMIATNNLPLHSRSIYSQQYQMARFIHRFYNGGAIAANDIGAINFLNDIACVDLTGLANRDIFFAKRSESYTTAVIKMETQKAHASIAIVYDSWFSSGPSLFGGPPLPKRWTRVARWRIRDREELGGDTVSFYAIGPGDVDRLQSSLKKFTTSLPPEVTVIAR